MYLKKKKKKTTKQKGGLEEQLRQPWRVESTRLSHPVPAAGAPGERAAGGGLRAERRAREGAAGHGPQGALTKGRGLTPRCVGCAEAADSPGGRTDGRTDCAALSGERAGGAGAGLRPALPRGACPTWAFPESVPLVPLACGLRVHFKVV